MKLISTSLLALAVFDVFAEEVAAVQAAPAPNPMSQVAIFGGFILIFYFLILRPQNKRAKAHRDLIKNLSAGDEIVTAGGLAGKVEKVTDDFIVVAISDNVTVKIQKSAVSVALPKGTLNAV